MNAITQNQRSRLEDALRKEIRHYERCVVRLPALDAEIYALGRELFSTDAGLALWLCAPARALSGKIPLVVARTKPGRIRVVGVLKAILDGGYL